MHVLTLVLGHHVQRQLALWGDRTRLSPYTWYLSERDLAMTRTAGGRGRDESVSDAEQAALIRRSWSGELADEAEPVGRDEFGWFIRRVDQSLNKWDAWTIGWRGHRPLIAKLGRPVIADESAYGVAGAGGFERAVWQYPTDGPARGDQARLGDLDLDAMLAAARGRYSDVAWGALLVNGVWHDVDDTWLAGGADNGDWWTSYVVDVLRRLPDDTLVTVVDCHH